MTMFRKSLGFPALLFALALILSAMIFMDTLYCETAAADLGNTARMIRGMIPEEELRTYFVSNIGKEPSFIPPSFTAESNGLPLEAETPYRITLINAAGSILWDSRVKAKMVNHLDREEVRAALEGRDGRAMRVSSSTGERYIYAALPVFRADGETAGVFRLAVTVPGFWQRIAPAASFFYFAVFLVLAAFYGLWRYSRFLSQSLTRLMDIVRETGKHPVAGINLSGEAGEFFTLERSLRGMAAELQRRLEEAQTEGSRLQTIINSMSGAVLAIDSRLSILFLNPPARALFKLESKTTWGLSLLAATRSTELEWAARKVLAAGKPEETELRLYTNNAVRRFQVFTAPLPSLTGSEIANSPEHTGAVMVLEDMTRLARLEQIRKDFVANVSHELRTPIQLIKGFSETLLELPELASREPPENETAPLEQIRRGVEIIGKNAVSMENLTNDLLTLAALEDETSGGPKMEETDLAPLFNEALASVEPQARSKNTAIAVDCPGDLKGVLHGTFIVQALINLLDNAIKYSPEGSRVWAGARREKNNLVLEVKDEGIGIGPEHLERIFERFYRVDRSRSREAGGTGLGLAIVRHIALLHGGTAEAESRAGEGSTFRVKLPC